jgi:hypothetical protein
LVADGEIVVDVPAQLSARARVFDTGQGRKADPVDTHHMAVLALRCKGLRRVSVDDMAVALLLLVNRRDRLGRAHTDLLNQIHKLVLELLPGGAKKSLSAVHARELSRHHPPSRAGWPDRRRLASELIGELVQVDKKPRRPTTSSANSSRRPAVTCTASARPERPG